jgi:hypothetical protein
MKNALISPNEQPIKYLSGWTTDTPPQPIYTPIANSCRVAEVEDQTFEVALPLFWTPCDDDVVADQWYYNTTDEQIYPVPTPAPVPEALIPNS